MTTLPVIRRLHIRHRHAPFRIVKSVLTLAAAATLTAAGADPVHRLAGDPPALRSPRVTEASGMTFSRRDPGKLWIINDSGCSAELHLTHIDGSDLGHVTVTGARNVDWEDLASYEIDGRPWLLIADTGDNDAKRPERSLLLLEEPALPADGTPVTGGVAVAREIRFRYQGGPRDCEAVAVDVPKRRILLVSKRTQPPELHELPLDPDPSQPVLTTRRLGTLRTESPGGGLIPIRDQPTGLDISADQSLAAIVTYYSVFLFPRKPHESWEDAFARKPIVLAPHQTAQAESIAVSRDGGSIVVVSEGRNPPLVRYRRD